MPSYRVSGDQPYEGHEPGTVFETAGDLDRAEGLGLVARFTEATPTPAPEPAPQPDPVEAEIKRLNVESHKP